MGIYKTINDLKIAALNTRMTNMVSFGDILEYNNKATIKYPYINLDVVTAFINNYSKKYTLRVYVCDRNVPYIAYNKSEVILDSFLKSNDIDIDSYTVNYFQNDFQDNVHGVWADISVEVQVEKECDITQYLSFNNFILQENGDYIRDEQEDAFVVQEEINLIKE